MKYIVVLGDGMADYPVGELGGRTPLQAARKPHIDELARNGEVGTVRTIPVGMPPASDVANLSVMGYDPRRYYTGRSPLEAVSMGLDLGPSDVAFRCNLVTLSEAAKYGDAVMLDYCSGEISTEEARELMAEVEDRFGRGALSFHPGVSYRHCMIWRDGPAGCDLTPPHDISQRVIGEYLPRGEAAREILAMMEESRAFLADHPVNRARRARGLNPATSIWLWGQGRKPALASFREKYGLSGAMISAVDLLKGIGICAGLESVEVEGATGNIDTNFRGKARAALDSLRSGADFAYVHVEAPDECGHRHEIENKVRSIELIDEQVVGTLLDGLDEIGPWRMMVLPDHPTPLSTRTHASDPVPFLVHEKGRDVRSAVSGFDEDQARTTGVHVEEGHALMDRFLGRIPASEAFK
jgi:2,3-bisphosphoglycerate-independent phosphoglycerate mutase